MIKRVLTVAGALSAIAGMAQAADTANGSLNLSANVPNTCYIRGITAQSVGNGSLTGGAAGADSTATLNLAASTVNPDTAVAVANTYRLGVSAYCNYAGHNIGLSSKNGGLTRSAQATVEGAFAQRIAYNAMLAGWGDASLAALPANGDAASSTATEKKVSATSAKAVNTTTATLTIDTLAGVNPLVEGSYGDVLTLRLGAAL